MGDKEPYQWDFDGSCAPGGSQVLLHQKTFSVGIFQWLPKKGGGLKRSNVVKRVKGSFRDPGPAFKKAEEICKRLNQERLDQIRRQEGSDG